MVDTSRGYADLKALFPDQQSRAIHPQGIRDLIDSIAHPVRGGGLDTAHVTQTDAFSIYAYNQHIPIASGVAFFLSVDPLAPELTGYNPSDPDTTLVLVHDPLGLATAIGDAAEIYGHHAGGKYLKNIPQGSVWGQHLHLGWDSGTWTPGDALSIQNGYPLPNYVYPDAYLDDQAGGIWGAPQYAYTGGFTGGWAGGNQQMDGSGHIQPFYETDLFDGPWNSISPLVFQTSGETQHLKNYQWDFWRIA